MWEATDRLDFERAIQVRERIKKLEKNIKAILIIKHTSKIDNKSFLS